MKIKQFALNHFETNCYVLWDDESKQCAIVDPCAETTYEEAQITQYIDEKGLKPKYILLTHAHVDHIAGLSQMCERYGLPVTMHADGKKLLRQAEAYGAVMGFMVESMEGLPVNEVGEDDELEVGKEKIMCRYVPGHCPGSMAYVVPSAEVVLTGDALFRGSIGRTDLPGGDYNLLIEKIRTRLLTLPDDYEVLPGHGDISTIGEERRYNGFLI